MKVLRVRALRGPNFWSRRTCMEALVDLEELRDSPSNSLPGFNERLLAWLPSLEEHRCGVGERGGFLMRLREGTWMGHVLEHVVLELQSLAGTPVGFGKTRETYVPGIYKVAFRYRDETVARAALQAALDLLKAAIEDRPFDVRTVIADLRDQVDRHWIGPSTRAIAEAAEARDIPWQRLHDGNLLQLGYGAKARRVWTAETDRTSAIAETISRDKHLTRSLLAAAGVPVPEGKVVRSPEEAWEVASEDIGLPVVVKPVDGNHGRGVCLDLRTREEVFEAWQLAEPEGSGVMVERFVPGVEHRLLVVGSKVQAAVRGETAWVVGDGKSTIQQLIDAQLNRVPWRGTHEDAPYNLIRLRDDPVCLFDIRRQGLEGPDSVPAEGQRVLVQRNGNAIHDCTDLVHPEVAATAVLAARVIGLDVAGIDLVAEDISRPLEEQRGAIVEVNAGPGLLMHLRPATGTPRPVGEAIVEQVFPNGQNGRIPLACITGNRWRALTTRMVESILEGTGQRLGVAASDGVRVGRRVLDPSPRADALGARKVLRNPQVDIALLEADPLGILREGLGFDRCRVAVVTDVGDPEGLEEESIRTSDDFYGVLRCPVDVVSALGYAVLNGEDPQAADMARLSDGGVILFARDPETPSLLEHRKREGLAVTIRDGRLVLWDEVETDLGEIGPGDPVPILAAAATGWALGLDPETIRTGLRPWMQEASR